jgi:biotin carboxylase
MTFVIFHRIPAEITPLASWLGRDVGERTILITPCELVPQYESWARTTIGLESYEGNELAEYLLMRVAKEEPIDRIIALSEYDLLRAARLRSRLGLPGQTLHSATAFRDKAVMKSLVSTAEIPVPPFRVVESAVDIFDFVEEHGFPVVVKPRAGAGSADTLVFNSGLALEPWLATAPVLGGTKMIEAYVDGDMYHVDGLIAEGHRWLVTASHYAVGCLAFQEGRSLKSVQLAPASALHRRLEAFAHRVLEALPAPELAAFHLEVFRTAKDELVFCEVASRIGGGRINDVLALRYGLNPVEYLFKREAGIAAPSLRTRSGGNGASRLYGWALVPPRSGVIVDFRVMSPGGGLRDFKVHCRRGQKLEAAKTSVSAMASVVVERETELEIEEALNRSVAEFEQSCIWEQPSA